jgi:uncharacterized RDD family membrane protein YckC
MKKVSFICGINLAYNLVLQSIDILTSQNVTISYELAGLQDRIFSFIIDYIALNLIAFLLGTVLNMFADNTVVYFVVYIPVTLFYSLISEILLNGRSLGKIALGLKVVKIDGITPSLSDYFVRWAFRVIDIVFSLGAVACMTISSSPKRQRIGDMIANTTVIKTNPKQNLTLADILNIRSLDNYTPQYPGIKSFTEQEMLLLKEVLDRYNRYDNKAHSDALHEAVYKVMHRLGMNKIPEDKIGFIKTLIKDYVALSR